MCKCHTGIYEIFSGTCITNPLNDTDCFVVMPYYGSYLCIDCLGDNALKLNQVGCEPACLAGNCSVCKKGYNNYCSICNSGFLLAYNLRCDQCPFNNCKHCQNTIQCLECDTGCELALNQRECLPISCPEGFISTGYECVCLPGNYFYYTPLSCKPCI